MNTTALATFADHVERNLGHLLTQGSVIRDIQRQWKSHPEATLPLLILGSEEDPNGLWAVVQALDQRFTQQAFSADDPEDIHMLESGPGRSIGLHSRSNTTAHFETIPFLYIVSRFT